jgi:hypothetical protein
MTICGDNFFIADIIGSGRFADSKTDDKGGFVKEGGHSDGLRNKGGSTGGNDPLSQGLAAMCLSSSMKDVEFKCGFHVYSRAGAVAAVRKALECRLAAVTEAAGSCSQATAGAALLELTVSPGQELFGVPAAAAASIGNIIEIPITSEGIISQAELTSRQLRPYYNSFPLETLKPDLIEQLGQLGYQLLNKADCPDSYTIVHLMAGREQIFASVTMAVDADLQPLKATEDSRLSETKRKAVEDILRAKTLADIFPGPFTLKVAFRNLSLQVCIL